MKSQAPTIPQPIIYISPYREQHRRPFTGGGGGGVGDLLVGSRVNPQQNLFNERLTQGSNFHLLNDTFKFNLTC